jgi:hypothetical protein
MSPDVLYQIIIFTFHTPIDTPSDLSEFDIECLKLRLWSDLILTQHMNFFKTPRSQKGSDLMRQNIISTRVSMCPRRITFLFFCTGVNCVNTSIKLNE